MDQMIYAPPMRGLDPMAHRAPNPNDPMARRPVLGEDPERNKRDQLVRLLMQQSLQGQAAQPRPPANSGMGNPLIQTALAQALQRKIPTVELEDVPR